jgi:hypothetical protein
LMQNLVPVVECIGIRCKIANPILVFIVKILSGEEGMTIAYNFGKNVAWVVKALAQPELKPETKRVML